MATLVLNNAFQPLGAVTETDAVIMIATEKAAAIVEDNERLYRSMSLTIPAPKVVILGHFQKMRSFKIKKAALTNIELFKRDNYICQYCGVHKDELGKGKKLTRDHIHPESRGGKNDWENVTTACSDCNYKKDNRTPKEAGMKLLSEPTTVITWTIRGKSKLNKEQLEYVEKLLKIKPL